MLISRKTSIHPKNNKTKIQNKKSESTVYLYGDIGGWFGVDHLEWIKEFNAISADTIHLRIDSSGGDVFAARAMKTAIMQHPANIIAHIDGLAASAASFLAMGANVIEMVDGGFLMIHNALSFIDIFGFYNSDDLDELVNDLSKEKELHAKINESIANDYMKRTGKSLDEVLDWMSAETWFTAKEALENNFIDSVYDGSPVEGSYDFSMYNNTPEPLASKNNNVTKRTIERALRDAGLSNKMAKEILADGFKSDFKDSDHRDDDQINLRDEVNDDKNESHDESQRDVDVPEPKKKDKTSDLLTRAEMIAPSNQMEENNE